MFICDVCKEEFKTEHNLKVHKIREHELWENYEGTMYNSFGCADQKTRVKIVANECVGTVLSVGGGDGNVEKAIIDKGHKLVFTDIDPKRIVNAEKYFGIKGGIVANAKDLSMFANRSFETVVCCETLEHIKDMGIALQELIRVASKKIILTFPISDLWDMDETHLWKMRLVEINRNGDAMKLHEKPENHKGSFIVLTMERINGNL